MTKTLLRADIHFSRIYRREEFASKRNNKAKEEFNQQNKTPFLIQLTENFVRIKELFVRELHEVSLRTVKRLLDDITLVKDGARRLVALPEHHFHTRLELLNVVGYRRCFIRGFWPIDRAGGRVREGRKLFFCVLCRGVRNCVARRGMKFFSF